MVKIMENPYSNGWFGGAIFFGNIHTVDGNLKSGKLTS